MRTVFTIFFLLAGLSKGFDFNALFQTIQNGEVESIRDSVSFLVQTYPENPEVLFLSGLIEPDGDKALLIYRNVLSKYPNSTVADNAFLKIIEYIYTKGLYNKTVKYSQDLIKNYPASECIADAGYFLLASLAAMNQKDSVLYYQKYLTMHFPDINFAFDNFQSSAKYGLQDISKSSERPAIINPQNQPQLPSKGENFVVQVGVFAIPNNAAALKSRLQKLGYPARIEDTILNGRNLLAVRVGDFATRAEAQAFGEKLKQEQHLEFVVIKK